MSRPDPNVRGMTPGDYETWYETARGTWIAQREFGLMMRLLDPSPGSTLLDVGCGTGHFSRRFAAAGLRASGLDPDEAMLDFARRLDAGVDYVRGTATALPLTDNGYDRVAAVTSLCFVADAPRALQEIWRVARHAVLLGLLNRRSLLYRTRHNRGSYRGARWDTYAEVRRWARQLEPMPQVTMRTAIFPPGGAIARVIEATIPGVLPWGGFLAVLLRKPDRSRPAVRS